MACKYISHKKPSHRILFYRLIDNYELSYGSFTSTEAIIQGMSSMCGPQEGAVSDVKVGRMVSSLWGNKVVKTKSSSLNGSGYRNLQIRQIEAKDKQEIVDFDETTVDGIRKIGEKFQNWIVDLSSWEKSIISFLRLSNIGEADVDVEGCRVFPEITVSLYPTVNIVIRTHGDAVPIEVVESSSKKIIVSLYTIERALRHVNLTCLCLGQKIPDDNNDAKSLDIAVSGSRFVTIKSTSAVSTLVISNSCLLLIPGGSSACEACQYAFKLCLNRKRKGTERADLANPMSEEGMNGTQASTSKEEPTSCNLADEASHEMLSFEKSDSDDLLQITEEISLKNHIPEDMKLLWDMQMKQLASKSANGHRWHPRFVIIFSLMVRLENVPITVIVSQTQRKMVHFRCRIYTPLDTI